MFIGLIQRIALLQINRMLNFTGDQGRKVIEAVYPLLDSPVAAPAPEQFRSLQLTQTLTYRAGPQVIQALDTVALVRLARVSSGVIEMVAAVGDTLVDLTPVLHVYGARANLSLSAEQCVNTSVLRGRLT